MSYREFFERRLAEFKEDPAFMAEEVVLEIMYSFEEAMQEQGVTRGELAERAGVSRAYVSEVLNGKPNMTILTLCKFALALGLKVNLALDAERTVPVVAAREETPEATARAGRKRAAPASAPRPVPRPKHAVPR